MSPGGPKARRPDRVAPATTFRLPARLDPVLGVLALAAAAYLLSIFLTHATALWRDEVSSVNTQLAPTLADMWARAEFESFPALWMIVLRGWLRLAGSSDTLLRLFGLLGPAALLAGVWMAAWQFGRIVPVLSLALLATNPEVMRWSSTLRPWGLGAGLALVALAALSATTTDRRRSTTIAATVLTLLAAQTVFQNVVILSATAAVCVFASHPSFWRRLLPAGVVIFAALTLVPYAGVLQRRAQWNDLGASHVLGVDLWNGFWRLTSSGGTFAAGCVAALVTAAIAIALRALWRGGFRRELPASTLSPLAPAAVAWLAPAIAVTSLAGLGVFYWTLGYPTQSWYYIGLLAIVTTLGEVALRTTVRAAAPAVRAAAVLVLAVGLLSARGPMREPLTNVDDIAARLHVEARSGDLVLAYPWFLGVTLSRYYRGPATVITIPPIADRSISRYDLLKQQMLEPQAVRPVIAAVDRTLASGHRVWLVGDYELPPEGTPDEALRLPPPPLPESGWNSAPYELLWAFQVGRHLRRHAIYDVVEKLGRGGRLEDVALRRFSGRRP